MQTLTKTYLDKFFWSNYIFGLRTCLWHHWIQVQTQP